MLDESKRYLWHFHIFLVLSILIQKGGVGTILEVYWGVGATHLVRCEKFCT